MDLFKRILYKYIIPPAGMILIYLLGMTYRKVFVGRESEQSLIDKGVNPIYALWHGRMLFFPFLYRWQWRLYVLVSPSIDGEIISRILKLYGVFSIRGSSYEGGTKALRELIKIVKDKKSVFITVDGSRGPVFKVQSGVLHLARLGGVPILPVTYGTEKAYVFKSWDRFIIPKPFSRVVIIYGEPVYIPRDLSERELEARRAELEKRLNEMTEKSDHYFKGGIQ